MFIFGVCIFGHTLYRKIRGISLEGFTTVIMLQCFNSSIIMILLGIIGYYLSKIYDEMKHRPKYIIDKRTEKSV